MVNSAAKNIILSVIMLFCTFLTGVANFFFTLIGYLDSIPALLFTLLFILVSVLFFIKADLIFSIPLVIYWMLVIASGFYNVLCDFSVIKYGGGIGDLLISVPVGGLNIFPSFGIAQIVLSSLMIAIPVVKLAMFLKEKCHRQRQFEYTI